MGQLLIGTSGYQFDDWFGTVYPENLKKKDVLEYYSKKLEFNTVEINYTYYRLPSARTSAAMVKKVPENFLFAVRSYAGMTHDIWEDEKRTVLKDTTAVFDEFVMGITPLLEAGKLGCVLLQFPYFFWPNKNAFSYLEFCRERLQGFDVVIEFRNRAWVKESTFAFLRKLGFGYCIVDEPRLKGLHPLVPVATSNIVYLRLHGRNPNWFSAGKDERYDYYYTEDELKEVISTVQPVMEKAERTFIYFNNCYGGKALKNALTMKKILKILREFNEAQRLALEQLSGVH